MKRNLFWRFLLVVFVVLWSVWEMNPPNSRDLIEEFKRRATHTDTNFTAIVARAEALKAAEPGRDFVMLTTAIGTNQIGGYFPFVDLSEVPPEERTQRVLHRLQRDAAGRVKLGLDLQGGTSFLVQMDTNQLAEAEARQGALSQAVEVLRKRVDKFGVAEPVIQPSGDDRILIQLPGLSEQEKEAARDTLQRAAFLEFRLVHERSSELLAQGIPAIGYTNMPYEFKEQGRKVRRSILVKRSAEDGLTGKYVRSAGVIFDPISNQPKISFRLDSEGARLFADITRKNVGRQLAVVLDGRVESAPVIRGEIPGGDGVIEGGFDIKEAFELANVLVNPLEAPVKIVEERGVDPSLGLDSIRSGIEATIIGTLLVSGLMLVYYLLAGFVANVALVLNLVITMGVMCSIGATLTLPGIAGMVLSVGMAVDANVLIYERIREELAKGKSLRGALAAGYDRAFGTILDSHITTLISSILLIIFGTGPVKGFGVTLTIGVAASLFTALMVTRLIFDWLLARGWLKSLRMLHIIRETRIDFMRYARPVFVLSWMLILIGLGYGVFARGHKLFGVDFVGGDTTTFGFAAKVGVEQIREAVTRTGEREAMIQYQKDLTGGGETLRVTTSSGTGLAVQEALKTAFPDAQFRVLAQEQVGAVVGKEIQKSALLACLFSLFGILVYVAFRYEFSFAVASVIAVMHDVLITIAVYCLANGFSGREFNATVVAALLTIIGFSMNDTIVIFDRIREDLKLGIRGTFKEVINRALNQTLSRTIITSGTVFLATISLYLFGGGVINDFAFTFLVGILTGVYSSIYIASAIVLWWHHGERPKTASQVVLNQAEAARV